MSLPADKMSETEITCWTSTIIYEQPRPGGSGTINYFSSWTIMKNPRSLGNWCMGVPLMETTFFNWIMHFLCNFFASRFWWAFFIFGSKSEPRGLLLSAAVTCCVGESVQKGHIRMDFLHWICEPTVIDNVDQERGWKIFLWKGLLLLWEP